MNLYLLSYYRHLGNNSPLDLKILAGEGSEKPIFILDAESWPILSLDFNWQDSVYNTNVNPNPKFLLHPLLQNIDLLSLSSSEKIIKSDNGSSFEALGSWTMEFVPNQNFEVLDSIGESKIYTKPGRLWIAYIRNLDGSYHILKYLTPFNLDGWNMKISYKDLNGKQVNSEYSSYIFGFMGCEQRYLVISNYDESDFTPIGTLPDGSRLYVEKDDSFLKQLYSQSYLAQKRYEINGIEEDDEKPFSLEEFKSKNPVIFWKTPFGEMAGFFDEKFSYDSACGFPESFYHFFNIFSIFPVEYITC